MKKLSIVMTQETRILLIAICHMINKLFVYSKQMTNDFKELFIANLFPYISTRFDTFTILLSFIDIRKQLYFQSN